MWLLLIHQLASAPAYLRVKIGRHLQRLGAVAVKNSVYALPATAEAREDFAWVMREISAGGGEGVVVEAQLVEGLADAQLRDLFRAARDADYAEIAAGARELSRSRKADFTSRYERLRRRLDAVAALDFFGAAGRETAEGLVSALAQRFEPSAKENVMPEKPQGATWVTRTGIHVDRMASAWLIRKFIDSDARLKFVPGKEYRPQPGELRFDMFDGEFTHEGDLCTFEVLLQRFGLNQPALRPIAEIIHDIDLKDDRYGRPDRAGVESVLRAIAQAHERDEDRVARATAVFDDLYQLYGK
ncbi:MAG: chromate resistance protein [Myxococcales bacterium]|nr:chromate resistance protein [Myxococcales bacterium]